MNKVSFFLTDEQPPLPEEPQKRWNGRCSTIDKTDLILFIFIPLYRLTQNNIIIYSFYGLCNLQNIYIVTAYI